MKREEMILSAFEFVRKELENDFSGHDIDHICRVHKNALKICEHISCDALIVELAAILHDVDDPKITGVYSDDCVKTRIFLNELAFEESLTDEICYIINNLSFSKNREKRRELSLEGKIVQDADRMDAIGAIGVARAFQYGGLKNRRMYGEKVSTINHFDEKLLKVYDLLNTEEAKKLALDRHHFLISFYQEFQKEIN